MFQSATKKTAYQNRLLDLVVQKKKDCKPLSSLQSVGQSDDNPILIKESFTQLHNSAQNDILFISQLQKKDYTKPKPYFPPQTNSGFVRDGQYTTNRSVQSKITSFLPDQRKTLEINQHFTDQKTKYFQRAPLDKPTSYSFFDKWPFPENQKEKPKSYNNAQIIQINSPTEQKKEQKPEQKHEHKHKNNPQYQLLKEQRRREKMKNRQEREKLRQREQEQRQRMQNINQSTHLSQKRAEQIEKEFLGSEINDNQISIKKAQPSTRRKQYNLDLYSNKKPLLEFNVLLKFLFRRDEDQNQQEGKTIPNNFESPELYTKTFEFLFLNECRAQLQQELQKFIRNKKYKYRTVQLKLEQSDYEGTIFTMQPDPDYEIDPREQKIADQSYPHCDLSLLKNYIVIFTKKFDFDLADLNTCSQQQSLFMGFLIEPQKSTYITTIRVQSFVDQNDLIETGTDHFLLIPFSKITTFIREYMMIKCNRLYTNLFPVIYNPAKQKNLIPQTLETSNIVPNPQILQSIFDTLQKQFNPNQFKSIKEISSINEGICLLQGPPGTGKTHTLLGLVSAVYHYMKKNSRFPVKKILICAPSNAAIDEIIQRILNGGIIDENGNQEKNVQVLRLGIVNEDGKENIKNVCLEEKAQKQLMTQNMMANEWDQKTTADLKIEMQKISYTIQKLEKKGKNQEHQKELVQLYDKKRMLGNYLDKWKVSKINNKERYSQYQQEFLAKAEIICTTLSSSGSDKLNQFMDLIDLLIVDEAAQSTEPSNLIPLRLGIKKMVLIGDPNQLPATTFSQISNETLYNRSLFERILDNKFEPYFLNVQYRMHQEIRMFPSEHFYCNKLVDHESIMKREFKFDNERVLFIDCKGDEQKVECSYQNSLECRIIEKLVEYMIQKYSGLSIGVICAYKSQVKLLRQSFKRMNIDVVVDTVDSFQGQEKDVIIFSCVRSKSIGFLKDKRRMNVALTRGREILYIVGNGCNLTKDYHWKKLIKNMIKRGLFRYYSGESGQEMMEDRWSDIGKRVYEELNMLLEKNVLQQLEKENYTLNDFRTNQDIEQEKMMDQIRDQVEQQEKMKQQDNDMLDELIKLRQKHDDGGYEITCFEDICKLFE